MDNFSALGPDLNCLDWILDDSIPVNPSWQRFQEKDFESIWELKEPLSDEERELFPDSTCNNDFSMDNSMNTPLLDQDPILTTAGLAEIVTPPLADFLPVTDLEQEEGVDTPTLQIKEEPEISYPISIHSYCLPPKDYKPEEALEGDEVHYEDESEDDRQSEPKVDLNAGGRKRVASISNQGEEVAPRRSHRQPKRRKFSHSETESEDETVVKAEPVMKGPKKDTFSNGKRKLYKSGPMQDPEMERARINAINAKRNRDRKKQERQNMEQEMRRLKSENQGLRRTANQMKERASNAEAELRRLRDMLCHSDLQHVLKATGKA